MAWNLYNTQVRSNLPWNKPMHNIFTVACHLQLRALRDFTDIDGGKYN